MTFVHWLIRLRWGVRSCGWRFALANELIAVLKVLSGAKRVRLEYARETKKDQTS